MPDRRASYSSNFTLNATVHRSRSFLNSSLQLIDSIKHHKLRHHIAIHPSSSKLRSFPHEWRLADIFSTLLKLLYLNSRLDQARAERVQCFPASNRVKLTKSFGARKASRVSSLPVSCHPPVQRTYPSVISQMTKISDLAPQQVVHSPLESMYLTWLSRLAHFPLDAPFTDCFCTSSNQISVFNFNSFTSNIDTLWVLFICPAL